MDKYDCIRVFIRVCKLGSFTAAANESNLTQSAVSKRISWLEQKIGFLLFHRNSRKIQLTAQGTEYLKYCEAMVEQMDQIESRLNGELSEVSGSLKLSVPSAMATGLLVDPLSQFMTAHPQLTVQLSVDNRQIDLIQSDTDIAIRVALLEDSRYKARLLFHNQTAFFAAPRYLKGKDAPTQPKDLASHQCLLYALAAPSNQWTVHQMINTERQAHELTQIQDNGPEKHQKITKVTVNNLFKSDSPEMLLEMALQGHGIVALPDWMGTKHVEDGRLIRLLNHCHCGSLPAYAVYKADDYQPYRVRAFIDFLADYFRK